MTPAESSRQLFPGGITIIGTGRLGSALALQFHRKGYVIRSLFNRSSTACEKIADQTGTDITGAIPQSRTELGDLIFLCLPDDQIPGFVRSLAAKIPDLSGIACVHTSGATPAGVLQPLADAGAEIASFHPVQTFTTINRDSAFDNCFITLQGDEALCKNLKHIARALNGRPLVVDQQQKTAIHLAAVFVCNYMTPLFSASQHILRDNGVEVRSRELFGPIVRQTMNGLLNNPPDEVLTGPVVRGDAGTVDQHLELLKQSPAWDRIYRELGSVTLRLAREITDRDPSSDDLLAEKFQKSSQSE